MDFTYLQSLSPSVYPVICGVFLCFLTLGLYFKLTSEAIDYWIFLGTVPSLFWNFNRLIEWMSEIFSSLGTGRGSFYMDGPMFSGCRFLVTCHPENIEYILKTNFDNFPKGENFKEVFDILGVGVFNVDSDTWRLQRKLIHSWLISGEFKDLVTNTNRKVVQEQLIPVLSHVAEQGFSIDLQDVFSRFVFDINMRLVFGRNENYLSIVFPLNEWADGSDGAHEAVFFRGVMPPFIWKLQRLLGIGKERAIIKARTIIDEKYGKAVVEKRDEFLAGGVLTHDFLSFYIKTLADETSVFSSLARIDNFLRDELLNAFLAGRDTMKSALTWLFWLVSITPSVKAKILEELNSVLCSQKKGKSTHTWPSFFDSDDLKDLVYLHAAICESLRLYPALPVNRKSVVKKDVLPDGSVVTPGMEILLSFYSVGRMPWIWGEDCLEYKPQRWIDENGKLIVVPTSKFPAFGSGARSCLGRDTAFTQMKYVVAAVLFNFHVEVVKGHHVCPSQTPNLYMEHGLQVNIKKRTV
ncbi:alkane hydroxylase MAH1-like [Papaver somniferum]|uniref:alkane hydroxylase MAH1-like n=1 Tax=Papaver somniferum TaxID=3469 RepID=UPI000E70106F|nr:alkane hydroxylase MAH1-like [Papaver somniferum]